jgi:cytoskeletal protein RodZ
MSDLGDLLRRARAYKGVTLRDAERVTRINRQYLSALESHDFEKLPPPAYARGIVRNYAQYLGLDPAMVLSLYETAAEETAADSFEVVEAIRPMDVHTHWAPNFAIIGFMLVVSAVVFAWVYSAYFQAAGASPTVTIAQSTPPALSTDTTLLGLVTNSPTLGAPSPTATVQQSPTPTEPVAEPTQTPPPPATTPTVEDPVVSELPEEESTTSVEEFVDESEPSETELESIGGTYTFTIVAIEEVWVQIYLDYAETPAWDGTLYAGEEISFSADIATVSSGNASFVQVYVDGEDYGLLGGPETWDAVGTYP